MFKPSKEEFLELSMQGNFIPVYCELLADTETALSLFQKIAYDKSGKVKEDYAFLLESVEGGENVSRYSFMGTNPSAIIMQTADKKSIF